MNYLPREKLEKRGLNSLTDVDLITIILGTGIQGDNVVSVARRLSRVVARSIQQIGAGKSFGRVPRWEELSTVRGVGRVKAMQISSALELGRRLYSEAGKRLPLIKTRSDVVKIMSYLKNRKQEHVVVLLLDARNLLIGRKTVAIGSFNKSVVCPRDIFDFAIRKGAAKIILVHNHPSGDIRLSKSDIDFTQRLREAGEMLGIELLDHVVV